MTSPRETYEARLRDREQRLSAQVRQHRQTGNLRLAWFVAGLLAIYWVARAGQNVWIAGGIVLFVLIGLIALGERQKRQILFWKRSVSYYRDGLERIATRRNARAEDGARFANREHPYAHDLDLFGPHSLFQLLTVCRTRGGENLLAEWLLEPAGAEEIGRRHEAIEELKDRLDVREDLAVLGEEFRSGVHPAALAKWAVASPVAIAPYLRYLAAGFSAIALALLAAWTLTYFADTRLRLAVLIVGLAEAAFFFRFRGLVDRVANDVEEPGHDLALLSSVLARLERETFECALLRNLRSNLTEPVTASRAIHRLGRLIELIESRDNLFVRIFGPLLLWLTQIAFAVERWRGHYGRCVPRWLETVARFEALSSLAAYRFEHPEDPLPEVSPGPGRLEAIGLAHPLLPACVPNDFSLGEHARLLILSGSNMSGKSTFLRTIGSNAVLALAGGAVRAQRMSISPMHVGASIQVQDSLEDGVSRFYAEILRVRKVMLLDRPILFLLDELLAGTNSHDRRIGAEAILRGLLERGGVGLASTHDLALTAIGQNWEGVRNVHFEDRIENGLVRFDYRLRDGAVTHSNALELMRAVGLEV